MNLNYLLVIYHHNYNCVFQLACSHCMPQESQLKHNQLECPVGTFPGKSVWSLPASRVELSIYCHRKACIHPYMCACFYLKFFLDISILCYILSLYFAGINVTTALSNPQKQFVKVSG